MTLSPEVLASLADCPLDWELLPLNGSKQPVDPETGQLMAKWTECGTDLDGITAVADSPHVLAVGLLLGPQSGGVLAVDFDGPSAAGKFREIYGRDPEELRGTIGVTSGRPKRGCLFLNVEGRDCWPLLKGRVAWPDADGNTCLELRWDRHFQVIAGAHPKTSGYRWWTSPTDKPLPSPAPDWLLEPLIREDRQIEPYVPKPGDGERALAMLACLPPAEFEPYDRWLEIGMALASVDPGLLSAWVEWSRGMSNFDAAECLAKWQTFKGGGITIATLHHHAKRYDYQPAAGAEGVLNVGKMPPAETAAAEGVCDVGKIDSPRWIVRDFLARGLMILAAEMGSGKSTLVYHCLESIQIGTPFLDQFPTTQARCLCIQGDEPEATARDKFHRMGITPAFDIQYREPQPLNLDWLEQLIASGNYDVIAADSIGSLLSSDDLEVTEQGMARVIYRLNKAFVDNGVAGVFTHHLNKPTDRMLRKAVTHHDFQGVHNLLSACTDIWSICRSPSEPDSFDLACHGKRYCRRGTIHTLQGFEEDFSWLLRSTSDGLLPQERLHLEQLIINNFADDPTPLTLDQLAQRFDYSKEHARRVALDLFDDKRIGRTSLPPSGRGRPKYVYGPAA